MNETIETMIENGDSLEVLSSANLEWLLEQVSKGGKNNE